MSCEEDTARPGPAIPLNDLLTEREASELTGHPTTVLAQYRTRRRRGNVNAGPEFVKVGTAVFYPRAAVEAYAARRG